MYGTFAVSESPIAGLPVPTGIPVVGTGRATVASAANAVASRELCSPAVASVVTSAQGHGFVLTIYTTAPGRGQALSAASARAHVEREVRVTGRTVATATAAAMGRLEIGNVVARWKTEPLPKPTVTTEPLEPVQHLYGFVAEDSKVTVSAIPIVTKVSTTVMADLQVSTSLSDD